jgi:acetoin utilization protein AcuB
MDVREAMTARPVAVTPAQTLAEALALMRHGRFRHLPVVADGALAGIVTERDLRLAEPAAWTPEHGNRPVRVVMTRDVIAVGPDDPVEHAARLMLENTVSCLPVLDGDALVGIITESDIFRAFVHILGVMEPGTRVQLRVANLAEALARIAEVAHQRGVRVVSIISEASQPGVPASLTVRFATLMIAPLIAALRASGLEVAEPDAGRTGSAV